MYSYVYVYVGWLLELADSSCDRGVDTIGIVIFLFDPVHLCSVSIMC